MFDDDVYVTYQMMKFMELADDIKRRGVLMPLQFHIKSDGFGVHPRKRQAIIHNVSSTRNF